MLVDVVQHRVHDLVTGAGGAGIAALGSGTVQTTISSTSALWAKRSLP